MTTNSDSTGPALSDLPSFTDDHSDWSPSEHEDYEMIGSREWSESEQSERSGKSSRSKNSSGSEARSDRYQAQRMRLSFPDPLDSVEVVDEANMENSFISEGQYSFLESSHFSLVETESNGSKPTRLPIAEEPTPTPSPAFAASIPRCSGMVSRSSSPSMAADISRDKDISKWLELSSSAETLKRFKKGGKVDVDHSPRPPAETSRLLPIADDQVVEVNKVSYELFGGTIIEREAIQIRLDRLRSRCGEALDCLRTAGGSPDPQIIVFLIFEEGNTAWRDLARDLVAQSPKSNTRIILLNTIHSTYTALESPQCSSASLDSTTTATPSSRYRVPWERPSQKVEWQMWNPLREIENVVRGARRATIRHLTLDYFLESGNDYLRESLGTDIDWPEMVEEPEEEKVLERSVEKPAKSSSTSMIVGVVVVGTAFLIACGVAPYFSQRATPSSPIDVLPAVTVSTLLPTPVISEVASTSITKDIIRIIPTADSTSFPPILPSVTSTAVESTMCSITRPDACALALIESQSNSIIGFAQNRFTNKSQDRSTANITEPVIIGSKRESLFQSWVSKSGVGAVKTQTIVQEKFVDFVALLHDSHPSLFDAVATATELTSHLLRYESYEKAQQIGLHLLQHPNVRQSRKSAAVFVKNLQQSSRSLIISSTESLKLIINPRLIRAHITGRILQNEFKSESAKYIRSFGIPALQSQYTAIKTASAEFLKEGSLKVIEDSKRVTAYRIARARKAYRRLRSGEIQFKRGPPFLQRRLLEPVGEKESPGEARGRIWRKLFDWQWRRSAL